VIGGERVFTEEKIRSINPAHPEQVVGVFQKAGPAEVEPAMRAALSAFGSWSRTPVEDRAQLLQRVAALIRRHKHEFSAWMVFEVGKNWAEADADTAETLDFWRILCARGDALRACRTAGAIGGRARLPVVHPAGSGGGDSAVELPGRDHGGHDDGRDCVREYGDSEPSSDSPAICRFFVDLLTEADCRTEW